MTLQELCLATIGNSLDRFCYAYCKSNSNDLRLSFQFLQKVYSSQLVSLWLKNKTRLPDSYADLVFSKYLKSADTGWFTGFSWKTIFDIFSKIGPSLENVVFTEDSRRLESLLFDEDSNDMQWKNVICCLPNVKGITYERYCNNGVLKRIAKYCPKLETLDVKYSYRVTGDGLKHFYQMEQEKVPCPLLKEIFLECTSVGFDSIELLLKNLPSLEKIDYSDLPFVLYAMHKNNLVSPDKVERYKLKHLNLLKHVQFSQRECYDDILEACITLCPRLKSIYCPLFKLEHLSLCCMLPDVVDLNLDCANSSAIVLNDVLKKMGEKLTSLTLRHCSVTLSVLAQYCYRLNHLTLNTVNIEYNENDSSPMFYNLKALTIKKVNLSNPDYCKAVCCILASSPTLENLYLKKCNSFSSEMKTGILKCCEQCALKLVHFRHSSVEAHFIKDILLTCSTLETFNSDVCYMYGEMESDLYRTAWSMPNRPEVVFCDELTGNLYFSDNSSEEEP